MDDLRRRFASLDRMPAPDLWDAIERRSVAAGPVTPVTPVVRPVGMRSGRSSRRQLVLLVAAASLVALVAGAFVAGGWRPVQLAIVVNPSPSPSATVALSETAVPPATASVSPSATASTGDRPWITGQELMDALMAEYGSQWTPHVDDGSTDPRWFESSVIRVDAPFDGPARVEIVGEVRVVTEAGLQAGRVAQALAPAATSWIQDAIRQGLAAIRQGPNGAGSSDSTTSTAGGGQVGVTFVDEAILADWMHVSFVPDPPRTRALEPGGRDVVYTDPYPIGGEGYRAIWVSNPDGSDATQLLAGARPAVGMLELLGWSADGSRFYYRGIGGGVTAIAADGTAQRTQIGCPEVVATDDCQGGAISPDGTRLATTTAILDIASGQVTRLDSTPLPAAARCLGPSYGQSGMPSWSPDGTHLVFANGGLGPKTNGHCRSALFTVAVDGSDLRRITPPSAGGFEDPRWSTDGSRIVFSTAGPDIDPDIFTIASDGTDVRALTSDGRSSHPQWTRDGRIVFVRLERGASGWTGRGEVRIMDADGSNARTLDTSIAAQTAAGCLVCPYPDDQGRYFDGGSDISYRYWQPDPPSRP